MRHQIVDGLNVPVGWTEMGFGRAFRLVTSGNGVIKNTAIAEPVDGLFPAFSASGQDIWLSSFDHEGHGLVLSAVGARCGKCFLTSGRWSAIANTHVLMPRQGFAADYLWYVANDETFWLRGGSAQPYVQVGDSLAQAWFFPPLLIQKAIADFLDRKTAAIDALIEKKQRLLALLAEKRSALISHILEASSAPSIRLARTVDLLPGYAFSSDQFLRDEPGIRLLRGINLGTGSVRWDDVVRWPHGRLRGIERFLLQPGDIVMGMDRPWIGSGLRIATVTETDCPCLLLQRVARLRPRPGLLPAYLRLTLEWKRFRAHLEPDLTGVSVPHLSGEQILSYRAPMPDLKAQAAIVAQCQEAHEDEAAIGAALTLQLMRLAEYRQALITAAVTGQLDIPQPEARG